MILSEFLSIRFLPGGVGKQVLILVRYLSKYLNISELTPGWTPAGLCFPYLENGFSPLFRFQGWL